MTDSQPQPTSEPTNDLDVLQQWKGRSETSVEAITSRWCERVAQTLGVDAPADGDVLPALWHFTTHLHSVPTTQLGRDGHPPRGGFLPPVALPRRMWAGSRLTFPGDIHVGDTVTKTSRIEDVTIKSGRSGTLCFVTVSHELSVDGTPRIIEEQDLVYREDPAPDAPRPEPKPAPDGAVWTRTVTPSTALLFRYSAITFNAHRIHYDREYARDVEGYDALVVQGPLTATLLAELACREGGRALASFSFRAMSPLFDTADYVVNGRPDGDDAAELWATTPGGGLAMQAGATFR